MPIPIPPKTTRLDLAHAIYTIISKEKAPPIRRYCILLAVAREPKPMTAIEIGKAIGDSCGPSGPLDNAMRHNFLQFSKKHTKGHPTYDLTTKGIEEVAHPLKSCKPSGPSPSTIRREAPSPPPTNTPTHNPLSAGT